MEKTKKCPYCGEEIHIEAQKCKHCGEWLDKENTTVNESLFNEEIECGNEEVIEDEEPFVEKGFFGYYWERIWRFHKFDTNGCVSRSEFWKYVLCCNVVCFFIMMTFLLVMSITGDYMKSGYIILMLISGALLLQYSIMSICMAVRRLHDNDKSGWLLLLSFIPCFVSMDSSLVSTPSILFTFLVRLPITSSLSCSRAYTGFKSFSIRSQEFIISLCLSILFTIFVLFYNIASTSCIIPSLDSVMT